jgi:hypothetical protein
VRKLEYEEKKRQRNWKSKTEEQKRQENRGIETKKKQKNEEQKSGKEGDKVLKRIIWYIRIRRSAPFHVCALQMIT